MKLVINKKNINVKLLTTLKERIISFRFKLDEIDEGICFYKKRNINTYMFCQKTDIVFTDINNQVLKICRNVATEKILFGPRNTFYIYILKSNTTNNILVNDTLNIKHTNIENKLLKKYKDL